MKGIKVKKYTMEPKTYNERNKSMKRTKNKESQQVSKL